MTPKPCDLDLAREVRLMAARFEARAAQREISFAVDAPRSLHGHVDPERFRRVLSHLLTNAIEAGAPGERLHLKLRSEGHRAVVEVGDGDTLVSLSLGHQATDTEREAIEKALRLDRQRLEAIISIAADAIISIDEEQRILVFNEGAERIFGWKRDEILGRSHNLLVPERFRATHADHVKAFGKGPVASRHVRSRRDVPSLRKNGEEFPSEAAISHFEIDGARYYSIVLRDVTERRQADEALRASEERLRLAAQAARFGTYDYVFATHTRHWSRELMEIYGVVPDGASPDDLVFTLTHPDDRERVKQAVLASLDPGGSGRLELEHRLLDEDGRLRWVQVRGMTLFDEADERKPIRVCGAVGDITKTKRAQQEQALLAEMGKVLMSTGLDYAETLSAMARMAARTFCDWCFVDAFEPGARTLRIEAAHCDPSLADLARRFLALRLDQTRPHLLAKVIETNQPVLVSAMSDEHLRSVTQSDAHLRLLRELRIRSFIGVPLLVRGELLGAMAFISSRGSRRFELDDLRAAQEIAVRASLALDNARLYELSRRAITARDQVLGIVAHDLRSPLGTIALQSDRLRRCDKDVQAEKSVQSIGRAAKRMRRLIDDMLDVARLEEGRLVMERQRVSPDELLTEVIEAHRPSAAKASLDLRLETAPGLPTLWADRDRLLQVFDNLLGNALKFTPPGGRVTLEARETQDEVQFCVRDTGIGMPPDHVIHVFDRFWQAGPADRRGAGLGLSIVRGIVESHGGRVEAQSEEGKGSMFCCRLPKGEVSGG